MKVKSALRGSDPYSGNWKTDSIRQAGNRKSMRLVVFFIATLGLVGAVESQQPAKVHRIRFLSSSTLGNFVAFRDGLGDLDYAEGKNIIIENPKARRARNEQTLFSCWVFPGRFLSERCWRSMP